LSTAKGEDRPKYNSQENQAGREAAAFAEPFRYIDADNDVKDRKAN
jgi:hypothetical protein